MIYDIHRLVVLILSILSALSVHAVMMRCFNLVKVPFRFQVIDIINTTSTTSKSDETVKIE